jgi:hypothetical protein
MFHTMFKNGIFLTQNEIIFYFLNKAILIIIIINLELYKRPLDILTDILLILLLAGQYILVILVMAPE